MSDLPLYVIEGRERFIEPMRASPMQSDGAMDSESTVTIWEVNYVDESIDIGTGKKMDLDEFIKIVAKISHHRRDFNSQIGFVRKRWPDRSKIGKPCELSHLGTK